MDIKQYQDLVDAWIKTVGVRYFSELTNTAILAEEVGEVARLMARIYGEQSFREGKAPVDPKAALADELADVIFVVTCIANQTGIDLTQALQKGLEKRNVRDFDRHKLNAKLNT